MTQERAAPENALIAMLETRRPAKSKSEREFIKRFIVPLGAQPDKRGNFSIRIGNAPIMWSCHTDSVHRMGGSQKLARVGETKIGLAKGESSNCLGADDTAGIWLMTEMIKSKVEGLYVFHREEENGCKGSRWIVKNNPTLVDGIKFAIALDRRDKEDIITFQSGTRCCSDEFAASLAAQLDMGFKACSYGSFTDTAQYTGLVPECTNLSVGYTGPHSPNEEQDAVFLLRLLDKLRKINVVALVEKRKAADWQATENVFPRAGAYGWYDAAGDWHSYNGSRSSYSYDCKRTPRDPVGGALTHKEVVEDQKRWWEKLFGKPKATPTRPTSSVVPYHRPNSNVRTIREDLNTTVRQDEDFANGGKRSLTMERVVRNHPEEVADYLEQYGIGVDEIIEHVLTTTGVVRCH